MALTNTVATCKVLIAKFPSRFGPSDYPLWSSADEGRCRRRSSGSASGSNYRPCDDSAENASHRSSDNLLELGLFSTNLFLDQIGTVLQVATDITHRLCPF